VPYTWAERDDGEFCVYRQKEHGGQPFGPPIGCHPTKQEALDQLSALYASEPSARTAAAPYAPPGSAEPRPKAAGTAMVAADTGRVLMIQRSLVDGQPGGGRWEFPGGNLDPGEDPMDGAFREWCEEVGCEMPDCEPVATWVSPNGVYQGFVMLTPEEAAVPINQGDARSVEDPDNPAQANYTEAAAWFDPTHLHNGPKMLRDEVAAGTPWKLIKGATPATTEPPAGGAGTDAMAAAGEMKVPVHLELDAPSEELLQFLIAAGSGEKPPGSVKISTGWAYPITDADSLHRATMAFGRAKPQDRAKVKAHIVAKAKELGLYDRLDDKWKGKSMAASAEEAFESLVASLAQPVSALLPDEPLPGPTPYTVNDDGTADGHLALWASCHIGYPGCVKPPQEDSFDFYNLGDAVTADGRHVAVGKVTVGCGHAGPDLSWRTAAAHYDESGTSAAVAHAVADKWGIRLPSVLVASATGEQIDELRRSPLSGDWRRINGRLRLVASLGVNVPGYPVPRALVASGEVVSMQLGFDPKDAAQLVLEADGIAAAIGLDFAGRAAALRASVLG
jgi:8-oxo-dGTP pyrophosphatase MutT (NUDIX family)